MTLMIRRHVDDCFYLIPQHEHGLLAGALAEHFGNERFAAPDPREQTILATAMHDCGWPLHDEMPTLNAEGLPLDVFEVDRSIALTVWTASADRAAQRSVYAGLLTSLHVMALSVYAEGRSELRYAPGSREHRMDLFAINKFQHQEVERQARLRDELGLGDDYALDHGLAPPGASAAEDRLTCNFRMLQAMDLISLAICCTAPPAEISGDVLSGPGGDARRLRLRRVAAERLVVDPWPFDANRLEFAVPFRRVRAKPFPDVAQFREAYAAREVERLPVTICAEA